MTKSPRLSEPGSGRQKTTRTSTSRSPRAIKLPPDPDGVNDNRAGWAENAVAAFQQATGTDIEDALPDLLCDLMIWADRRDYDFGAALARAREHYVAETEGSAPDNTTGQQAAEADRAGKPIVIEVRRGCVTDVRNVPVGYEYEIVDHDDPDARAEDEFLAGAEGSAE